jgi:hypothetical protein
MPLTVGRSRRSSEPAYSKHLGDPAWTHFIRRLEAESPAFAEARAAHDVAQPSGMVKNLRHPVHPGRAGSQRVMIRDALRACLEPR